MSPARLLTSPSSVTLAPPAVSHRLHLLSREQVGQQIFNDMYRDAVQASEKGDLRQAMEKYLQCIQVLTPPDGVISATNGGNGLHVHLFNQLAKVMMSDQMLEGAEEYSERAADLGEALLKKRRDELKRKPDAAMDEEGEEEEEQEEDEGEKAAPKSKFDDKVRDETERDEVRVHAAVSPRPPSPSDAIVAHTQGYTSAAKCGWCPSFRGHSLSPRAKPYSS